MGFIVLWTILLGLISIELLYFFYIVPLVMTFASLNLFVLLTHKYGYRTHDTKDESRNNWFISLLLFGEGWHNTHHYNSKLYNLREKWWEIDLCGDIIGIIKHHG
jgi:stearoyl-CoA desaturase (delta-9 desaturase)